MALDLTAIKAEILTNLEQQGFATFYTDSSVEGMNIIYWDVRRHPSIAEFLNTAKSAGSTLVTFYERTFSQVSIDDTLERLEEAELGREEKRSYELRLKELQKFEGFICELEVSFPYGSSIYQFQVQTDWFEEFETIFADVAVGEADLYDSEEDDEGPISGYFSKN
jgi:hypothetical protein